MLLKEMMENERNEGKAEGIELGRSEGIKLGRSEGMSAGIAQGRIDAVLLFLQSTGEIPDALKKQLLATTDTQLLDKWILLAGKAVSVEEFAQKANLHYE